MIFALLWKFTLREGLFQLQQPVSVVWRRHEPGWCVVQSYDWDLTVCDFFQKQTFTHKSKQFSLSVWWLAPCYLFTFNAWISSQKCSKYERKCWPKSMSDAHSYNDLTHWILLATSGKYVLFFLLAPTSTSVIMREAGGRQLSGTNSQNKNINLNGNLRRRSHHCQHLHWRSWLLLDFGLNFGWQKACRYTLYLGDHYSQWLRATHPSFS